MPWEQSIVLPQSLYPAPISQADDLPGLTLRAVKFIDTSTLVTTTCRKVSRQIGNSKIKSNHIFIALLPHPSMIAFLTARGHTRAPPVSPPVYALVCFISMGFSTPPARWHLVRFRYRASHDGRRKKRQLYILSRDSNHRTSDNWDVFFTSSMTGAQRLQLFSA